MAQPGPEKIDISEYIEIAKRRKWFIIIPFLLSLVGTFVYLKVVPPLYKSSTVILVEPQKVPKDYITPTVTVDVKDRLSTITQQVMSRTRLESIIKEFNLYPEMRKKQTIDEVVDYMRKHIELKVKNTRGKKLASFTISYIGEDPETVMNVTNRLASLFIEENLKIREQEAEGTTQFLESQLEALKKSLEEQEAKIKAFKQKYMGELPSQLEANLRTLDRLQLELQTTNDALKAAQARKIAIEKQLAELSTFSTPVSGEGPVDPRVAKLEELKTELAKLLTVYTEDFPDVKRLKMEIATLEKELGLAKKSPEEKSGKGAGHGGSKEGSKVATVRPTTLYLTLSNQLIEVNSEIKSLKEKQKSIMRNINIFQARVERTPQREQELAALMRDYENTRENYQNLLNKKIEAQLAENLEKRQKGEQFRILDPANLPQKPFKPDVKRVILVGFIIGLGSGGGLAFLLEYLDASFRKPEDVYEALGFPVIATIPKVKMIR